VNCGCPFCAGQFCGKEDKEKFEIDQKGSGSGNESNFGRNLDTEANLIYQCVPPSLVFGLCNAYRNAKCACMIFACLCLHVDEWRHECEQSVLKNTKLCD